MNTTQTFFKNASALLLANYAGYIPAVIYQLYIIRYLGAAGFGVLSFAIAFTAIFGIFADFGVGPFVTRELARDRSQTEKYASNYVIIKTIFVTVVLALLVGATSLLGYPQNITFVIYIFAFVTGLTAYTQIFNSVFEAHELMEYESIGTLSSSCLILAGVVVATRYSSGVIGISLAYLFASIVVLIYSFIVFIYKFGSPRITVDPKFIKFMIWTAFPFGLTGTFTTVYFSVDSVILGRIQGAAPLGWYSAAYRFVMLFATLPTVLNVAIFPAISRVYISSPEALKKVREKYFKFWLMLSIPMAVIVTLLADKLVLLLFGLNYVPSIIALQILIWAYAIQFLGTAPKRVFEATKHQALVSKIFGLTLAENVIINIFLITRFSYVGAAVTELISDLTLFSLLFYYSYRLGFGFEKHTLLVNTSKVALASLVAGAAIWVLRTLNLFILLFGGIVLYVGTLYLIKGIDKEDLELLKELPGFARTRALVQRLR